MTRNLYLGADLTPLQSALTPADVASLAGGIWREIQDSSFAERATEIAAEIVRVDPDVVALQEVSLYQTQTPSDWISGAAPNATYVELDFLTILLDALADRGVRYQAAIIGVNADAELPATAADGTTLDVRLTDRDVILVREGVAFVPGSSGRFPTAFGLPIGGADGATLRFDRGYVTTDVTVAGNTVRVVDSHLEIGGLLGRLQEQQARELLTALSGYGGQMILAGDFNSPADGTGTTTYALLTTKTGSPSPFRDSWDFRQAVQSGGSPPMRPASTVTPGLVTDFTCCVDLRATMLLPSERIDLVLFRGGVLPVDVVVVDTAKTTSGLWPSDHLGVFAKLEIR